MADKIDENFENLIAEIEAEEKGIEKKKEEKTVEEKPTEIIYAHREILEEEGLTKKDVPAEITKMIDTFDRKLRMAKIRKAPEATFLQIQNLSTLIGDRIITYIESKDREHETIVVEKKEDGGGIDDGSLGDDGGTDDGGTDDGGTDDGGADNEGADDSIVNDDSDSNVEDDLDELDDGADSDDAPTKGGMFEGVLGGIFNW